MIVQQEARVPPDYFLPFNFATLIKCFFGKKGNLQQTFYFLDLAKLSVIAEFFIIEKKAMQTDVTILFAFYSILEVENDAICHNCTIGTYT